MAKFKDRVFIGVGGHVVAIDLTTGAEIWRTKVKRSSFVTLSLSPNRIFAGAGGELYCLDPATGSILWHNKLKGLGFGVVAFAGDSGIVATAAAEAQRQAAGHSAG